MNNRKIERMRPEDEMPQVFWECRHDFSWLKLALYAEKFRTIDEGREGCMWCDYIDEALVALNNQDFNKLTETIEAMARYQHVTIDKTKIEIC